MLEDLNRICEWQELEEKGLLLPEQQELLNQERQNLGQLFRWFRPAKGRKGTNWDYIENLLSFLEPEWVKNIQTGLSSGEGLIWAVREKGRVVDYEDVVIDKGIDDKRLLIVEGEFASPLKIMEGDEISCLL